MDNNSQEHKKLERFKKVYPEEDWYARHHYSSLIPVSLPDDLSDDDLYQEFYSGMRLNTEEEGTLLKFEFTSHYRFGNIEDKHLVELGWKGEIDTKGKYLSPNKIFSAIVEWLVADGLDYLYAGRFEDAILTFSLERKLREFNTIFAGFPSNACIWIALGMIYMIKNPEQSFKCIKKAKDSLKDVKQSYPKIGRDLEKVIALLDNPLDIKIERVLNGITEILIRISYFSESLSGNRKEILREIDRTIIKALPTVENRVKKKLIESVKLSKEQESLWSFWEEFGISPINSIWRFFKKYGECILILWRRTNFLWALVHSLVLIAVLVTVILGLITLIQKTYVKINQPINR